MHAVLSPLPPTGAAGVQWDALPRILLLQTSLPTLQDVAADSGAGSARPGDLPTWLCGAIEKICHQVEPFPFWIVREKAQEEGVRGSLQAQCPGLVPLADMLETLMLPPGVRGRNGQSVDREDSVFPVADGADAGAAQSLFANTESGLVVALLIDAPPAAPKAVPLRHGNHMAHLVFSKGPFRLYVGNVQSAKSEMFMVNHRIEYVVNCAAANGVGNMFQSHRRLQIQYAVLDVDDDSPDDSRANPAVQWPAIMRLMEEAYRRQSAVLVHCWAGMNRSVTTAALFLTRMGHFRSLSHAVESFKKVRPVVAPYERYLDWAEEYLALEQEKTQK